MTSQGAGAPSEGSQLDLDEADRLAESIRPAWETDDGSDDKPRVAAAPEKAAAAVEAKVVVSVGAPASGAEPPRDTVIDGAPMMPVGKTDPGRTDPAEPLRPSQLDPAKRPVPPKPSKATVMGLGATDDVAAIKPQKPAEKVEPQEITTALPVKRLADEVGRDALADAEESPSSRSSQARPSKGGPARSKRRTSDVEARDSDGGRSRTSGAAAAGSAAVSFSKVDDPVELPVEKSSKGLYIGGALALVGVLVVGGLMSMRGDDAKQPAPAKTQASEPLPAKEPDPKPAATEAKKPDPTPTAAPVETAAPTAEATSAPTAEPVSTTQPLAKQEPTKPAGSKPPSGGQTGGGSKPPSGGGGGKKGSIMRDAPF